MATLPIGSPGYPNAPKNGVRRTCPHCGSDEVYRSRARGIIERHVVRVLRFFPYRCFACDRRFYLHLAGHEGP